jgi:plastocyanin
VRRGPAAVAGLALIGALVLAPDAGWIAPGNRAAAAECAWQRHTKRVVKQVRRGGKSHRVSRARHWWTCDALPVPQPPGTIPPAPPVPVPAPVAEEAAVARLGVRAQEFGFEEYAYTLSRPTLAAGEAIVELNNQGEDPHNLNLQLVGGEGPLFQIPDTDPLQRTSAHFTLPAGVYRLWCSLPEHDERGMNATLVVDG